MSVPISDFFENEHFFFCIKDSLYPICSIRIETRRQRGAVKQYGKTSIDVEFGAKAHTGFLHAENIGRIIQDLS